MKRLLILVFLSLWTASPAQQNVHLEIDSSFGSYVEEDFPYFTQTLDAREFGEEPIPQNLTPRGIIVKLGHGHYGCFDPDLLRWALVWKANEEGEYLTMDGMAPGSYRLPNRKAPSGQKSLPKPIGIPVATTPLVSGVTATPSSSAAIPRERGSADSEEVGLGPIPAEVGRFSGLLLPTKASLIPGEPRNGGLILVYEVAGVRVEEKLVHFSHGNSGLRRSLTIAAHEKPIGIRAVLASPEDGTATLEDADGKTVPLEVSGGWIVIPPSEEAQQVSITRQDKVPPLGLGKDESLESKSSEKVERRWSESITLPLEEPSRASEAFVFDDLPLPVPNPWSRNVRLSGLDFFPDGRAVFCTFDGDVWTVDGLEEGSKELTWSRFASGLHEPKSVCVVDEQIYVFDRNGIVRLHDNDGNGEADWYENFSNIVDQTAETREFAMDMVATEDGGFLLAKGGQVGSTKGKLNGTIVKVSADGRSYEVVATGLRQPYIGYDPETGILTSSDQQGHWKPATPIYRIEAGRYYGFQPAKLKDKAVHPAPIAQPEIWIPHFINQSGASQVWMKGGAKMGALDGSLVHIGYNRPEIFRVYLDESRGQAAATPLLSGFPAGVIKGRVHPIDGRLYLTGFEIWGTSGERVSGLFRVRPTGAPSWVPSEVKAFQRGVLLTFDHKLSLELAGELGRYSADRWNYQQTHNYGSGNFRLDGEPGQESVPLSSVAVSKDSRSLFLAIPDMRPSHSLRITYRLPVQDSTRVESTYLSVWNLREIDLTKHGFSTNEVDMTPRQLLTTADQKIDPTPAIGKEVAVRYGCVACHATGESDIPAPPSNPAEGAQVAVGPAWNGLWSSRREFTDGSFIKSVDETYLRESILDPGRRVAQGFETEKTGVGMPSYLGVLKDHEIDSVILYIKTLAGKKKAG